MSVDPVSLAITVALNAAAMALTASKKIEGPRLSDLKASTADYGTPMVQFYGTSRLECPCIYAENLREVKTEQKTKGGKYDKYTYYGTWASLIADCPTGPIDSVLALFLDRHLIFQTTSPGAVALGGAGLSTSETGTDTITLTSGTIRFHKGTADQLPDPRLLAKITEKEGGGTCPAYRYIAYAVFEEIPLEPFGNHLPQTSIIATRSHEPSYPWEWTPGGTTFVGMQVSRELGRIYIISVDGFVVWDCASRTLILDETLSGMAVGNPYAIVPGDAIYAIDGVGDQIQQISLDGGSYVKAPLSPPGWVGVYYAGGNVYLAPGSFTGKKVGLVIGVGALVQDTDYYPSYFFTNIDGDAISVGTDDAFGATEHFYIGPALDPGTVVDTSSHGSYGPCLGMDNGIEYVVKQGDWLYRIDRNDFHIVQAFNYSNASNVSDWNVIVPGAPSFWDGLNHIDARNLSVIETADKANWVGSFRSSEASGASYEPTTNALISGHTFGEPGITWRYIRSNGSGITLGDICTDVAVQSNMSLLRTDFSDLDQNIPGYAWTQGAGKDIVGPLLDLHDSDIRPHGFIQQGLKRGQPYAAGPIFSEFMVNETRGQDAASQPLYSLPITAETDLPLRVAATFSDPNLEDQPNTVHAQRNQASVRTSREQSFDLTTLREQPDTIQGLLERALRRFWVGATKPTFLASPAEITLEPADVRPIVLEDGSYLRCRNTKAVIRANRVIETEWELDGETLLNRPDWTLDDTSPLNAVYATPPGLGYGRPPDTIPVPGPVKGFVFDTPLLSDADDQTAPFLYDAAGAYVASTFVGAMVFTADDLAADTVFTGGWDAFASTEASSWGHTTEALPDAATDVMDEASVLKVTMIGGGTLSSVTTDQLLADQSLNLALVGDELIQFRAAEEVDTNQYELTGLIRGARNSEYAATGHAAGEDFLLISSKRHKRTIGAGEIGDTDYYKFTALGDDLAAASVIAVPFAANAHRPPAPAHLALVRDAGTGDWSITWIRRTRVGGGSVNGQDVPLGETSEAYHVKIMNGGSVLATYDTTTSSFTYTAAEQTADWGSAQTHLTVEVCQMSTALSIEGFTASASA